MVLPNFSEIQIASASQVQVQTPSFFRLSPLEDHGLQCHRLGFRQPIAAMSFGVVEQPLHAFSIVARLALLSPARQPILLAMA